MSAMREDDFDSYPQEADQRERDCPSGWPSLGLVLVGLAVMCAGLLLIRACTPLMEGPWYLPITLAFFLVVAVGSTCIARGMAGVVRAFRGR